MKSLFSCEEFSKRLSRSKDEELCFSNKFKLWFHYLLCFYCRRFSRQLDLIHKGAENIDEINAVRGISASSKESIHQIIDNVESGKKSL